MKTSLVLPALLATLTPIIQAISVATEPNIAVRDVGDLSAIGIDEHDPNIEAHNVGEASEDLTATVLTTSSRNALRTRGGKPKKCQDQHCRKKMKAREEIAARGLNDQDSHLEARDISEDSVATGVDDQSPKLEARNALRTRGGKPKKCQDQHCRKKMKAREEIAARGLNDQDSHLEARDISEDSIAIGIDDQPPKLEARNALRTRGGKPKKCQDQHCRKKMKAREEIAAWF